MIKKWMNIIKIKINQIFCGHGVIQEMKEKEKYGFSALNGERIYLVCKKCGKVIGSYFREYEGMGYK